LERRKKALKERALGKEMEKPEREGEKVLQHVSTQYLLRKLRLKFKQFIITSSAVNRRVHVTVNDYPAAKGSGTE